MINFLIKKDTEPGLTAKREGFTLVETLVALSIFTLSVLALMVALGGGLKSTQFAKSKITASYLAQEGVELMRNMRDTFVLYDGGETGWANFLTHVSECDQKGCIFHTEELDYGNQDQPITDITLTSCGGNICPPLYFHENEGSYDYDATPPGTVVSQFRRHIRIEVVNPHEARIHSFVFWGEENNSVGFIENIFDWN